MFLKLERQCQGGVADLVFVVDSSGSINQSPSTSGQYTNWELSLRFLTDIIDRVDAGGDWRIGMVVYSHSAENRFFLNTYTNKNSIKNATLTTSYTGGGTDTADGIRTARTQQFLASRGDRTEAPNVVFVLTDGMSSSKSRFVEWNSFKFM